jgi:hypothetical protein
MSINKIIIDALIPLGVPVRFQTYEGNDTTYITFFSLNERGSLFVDDEENETDHSIQVDIWSNSDYTELVQNVKILLKENGFIRTSEVDLYEKDLKIYHKPIRFLFTSTPQ